jgi:hypothetical protein
MPDVHRLKQEAIMDWMIYGANGYTGELIAREAKKRGANPVLAGRAATKIVKLATDLSLPSTFLRPPKRASRRREAGTHPRIKSEGRLFRDHALA